MFDKWAFVCFVLQQMNHVDPSKNRLSRRGDEAVNPLSIR